MQTLFFFQFFCGPWLELVLMLVSGRNIYGILCHQVGVDVGDDMSSGLFWFAVLLLIPMLIYPHSTGSSYSDINAFLTEYLHFITCPNKKQADKQ